MIKRLALTMATILAGTVAATGPALPAAAAAQKCESVIRTVNLSALDRTPYRLVGWLCWRGSLTDATVQVLVHGLTYDHNYWDFPAGLDQSYVQAATAAGYATLNIDRIGVGASARPLNATVLTTESAGYALRQLIQSLRTGAIGGTVFHKVITVGHSFGSQAVAYEAGTYRDVDGVILSGSLHQTALSTFTQVLPAFHPAQIDPKFGPLTPAGYVTTIPGTRDAIFYNPATARLDVIAADEDLKQTATDGEVATVTNGNLTTQGIQVPVLLAVGERDLLFCDALVSCADAQAVLARESGSFSARACPEAYVLPLAGHSLNLHLNAGSWFAVAAEWADRRVGTRGPAPTQPC